MITGNQNPVAGKDEFYTFTDYTQMFETPDIQYNWAIWKKKTGKWVNITERPPKPGKSVSFNFGQGAIGEEFRLEVYKAKKKLLSDEWEAKKMGEIFVVPTNSKTPKISKVVLFNRGARDPNKASYQDTLIAQAHCVAMFNQEVEFNLWEDDAEGGGHNAEINKNNKAPKIYKARVNEKGIAEAKISLLSDANVLKQIANRYMMRGDPNEGANHEFYVTASYSGKIKGDSKVNVSVANPDHRPKTKPKDDTPKFPIGSTGAGGGVRQPDPEGNIRDAYFVNNNGQQLSKVSIGEHVKIRILSKNMIGKRIQYVVWEYDATSNDEVYRSGVIKIIADACDTGGFTISPNIFDKGIDFGSVGSDATKQNYFIEIISFDTSNTSKKFGVTADGLMTVEKAKSAAVVQNTPEAERPRDGKCPNCEKDITIQQLQQVYPQAKDQNVLVELCKYLNKYKTQYKLDTCARKAHFFAQSIQETGTDLRGAFHGENLDYAAEDLPIHFKAFRKRNSAGQAVDKNGNQTIKNSETVPNELAYQYGRSSRNGHTSNQKKIAEIAYGNRPELGNKTAQDTWNFRGRGLLQITGRTTYSEIQKRIDKFASAENIKIEDGIERDYTPKEAALTGMADWYKDDMFIQAAKTGSLNDDDVVNLITNIINPYTSDKSKKERRDNYKKTKNTFQVAICSNISKEYIAETTTKNPPKNGYDIDKAVEYIISHAKTKKPYGDCALYVRRAINAGGIKGSWGDAYQYLIALPSLRFTDLGKIDNFKKGDIVVFNRTGNRKWGHIAMWTGSQWISDFKQNSIIVHNDYIGKDYHVFRWQ